MNLKPARQLKNYTLVGEVEALDFISDYINREDESGNCVTEVTVPVTEDTFKYIISTLEDFGYKVIKAEISCEGNETESYFKISW